MLVDAPARDALGRRATPTIVVLAAAPFVAVLDTTIVTLALPAIRDDLAISTSSAQWVLTGYSLSLGSLFLLGGRVGDRIGRRRVFTAGLWLFAAAALAGGLAPSTPALVAARFLMGVGAAAFLPCALSLVTASYQREEDRTRALAVFGASVGAGFVVAMVIGGVLTSWLTWRSVFLVNVPIAAYIALVARRVLQDSRGERADRRLDVLGALLCMATLVLLILALTRGPEVGWRTPVVTALFAAAAVAFVAMVLHLRRVPNPLVPYAALGDRPAAAAYAIATLRSIVGIGQIFLLTMYFQDVRNLDPLVTGLLFTPMAMSSVLTARLAACLTSRIGVRRTLSVGLVIMFLALPLLALFPADGAITVVVVAMVVAEVGFMLSEVPNTLAGATRLGARRAGLAAGLLGTSQQLGHAFGVAIIASIVSATAGDASASSSSLRWGLVPLGVAILLALALCQRWCAARVEALDYESTPTRR